jgi:hypothetical protein
VTSKLALMSPREKNTVTASSPKKKKFIAVIQRRRDDGWRTSEESRGNK